MEYIQILGGKFFGGGGNFNLSQETGLTIVVVALVALIVIMAVMGRGK